MQKHGQKVNKQTIALKVVAPEKQFRKMQWKGEGAIHWMYEQCLEIWSNQVQNQVLPVVQLTIYFNMQLFKSQVKRKHTDTSQLPSKKSTQSLFWWQRLTSGILTRQQPKSIRYKISIMICKYVTKNRCMLSKYSFMLEQSLPHNHIYIQNVQLQLPRNLNNLF